MSPRKRKPRRAKRLRAILRAPELAQSLYRDGLISQTAAAKMGPSKPTPASLHTAPVLRSSTDVPARRVCALRHRFSPI